MSDSTTTLAGLDFVEKSGVALSAAQQLAEGVVTEQEKVAAAVPARVDFLLESNLIPVSEKEAAVEQLSRHDGALDAVGSLTQIIGERKQASDQKIAELTQRLAAAGLGESDPNSQKTAAATSPGQVTSDLTMGGYVGQRGGDAVRDSDLPLLKAAGLR